MPPKIIQEIELSGATQINRDFQQIGASGAGAFEEIQAAASKLNVTSNIRDIDTAAKRAGVSFGEMAARVSAASASASNASKTIAAVGPAATATAANMNVLGASADQAAVSFDNSSQSAVRFGQMVRLLGRALGIRELSQLGRAVGVLGRVFKVAAPLFFAVGIERLASSAAKAADETQTLANESKLTTDEFQSAAAAGTALGLTTKEMGESFKGVNKLIQETADHSAKTDAAMRKLGSEMQDARDKGSLLAEGFDKIRRESEKSSRDLLRDEQALSQAFQQTSADLDDQANKLRRRRADLASGGKVSDEEKQRRERQDLAREEEKFEQKKAEVARKRVEDALKLDEKKAEAARKQREETVKLNREIDENDKKQKEIARQLRETSAEADRNATALEKLGIKATTANGKLAKAPETLLAIADALKNTTDESKRQEIEFDLIAAGIDRRLIPALRQGSAEYQKLAEFGKQIRPPFTTDQIKTLDAFAIAGDQVGRALAAIRDQVGAALAPAFIDFFAKLRDIFIAIRPGLAEFASVLGEVVKPILDGMAVVLKLVTELLQGFFAGLDVIAKGINQAFGTSLTGMQLFVGIVVAIGIAFGGVHAAILLVVAAIGTLGKDSTAIVDTIKAEWKKFADSVGENWDRITKGAQAKWQSFIDWFRGTIFGQLITWVEELTKKLEAAFGAASKLAGANDGTAEQAFGRGGKVWGSGNRDTVPAWLTPNEFVMKRAATRKYGFDFMRAINSLRFPKEALQRFAGGGPVMRSMMPRPLKFAKGGRVPTTPAMRKLDVHFGGETFEGLLAPEHVASKMERAAIKRRNRSGGRKPGYYGGGD